jgi:hypothetical protein
MNDRDEHNIWTKCTEANAIHRLYHTYQNNIKISYSCNCHCHLHLNKNLGHPEMIWNHHSWCSYKAKGLLTIPICNHFCKSKVLVCFFWHFQPIFQKGCVGESYENIKILLPANLGQIGSVQLCYFQHGLHCVQCMSSGDWLIPGFLMKKKSFGCIATDAPPLALLHQILKSFHQEPPWVAQWWGRHSKWMSPDRLGCHVSSMCPSVVCMNQTPALSSPQCFYLMAGLRLFLILQYVALVIVVPLDI